MNFSLVFPCRQQYNEETVTAFRLLTFFNDRFDFHPLLAFEVEFALNKISETSPSPVVLDISAVKLP